MTESKPLINIKLPISCKTKKEVGEVALGIAVLPFAAMFGFLDWCSRIKIIQYAVLIPLGIIAVAVYSVPGFILGGWIIGALIGIATGHGHELMSDQPWTFWYGAAIGVVIQWIIIGMQRGVIKFSCRAEPEEKDVLEQWGLKS